MPLPPTLWPAEETRCPYCVEEGNFKLMAEGEGGVWFKCDRCGHIVMPGNKLFEWPCLKCYDLRPPGPKKVKPTPHR